MFKISDQNKLKRILGNEYKFNEKKKKLIEINIEKRSFNLKNKSLKRLQMSRFRAINEFLYCHQSNESQEYLSKERFQEYHNTYDVIANKWPKRPVDDVIQRLKTMKLKKGTKMADIGCGRRPLIAEAFPNLKVFSYDLISLDDRIIAADMTSLPLEDQSLDICVYSLSLMATNLTDCLKEANRVLKLNTGTLLVAEVQSRFDPDEQQFVSHAKQLGFELKHTERVTDFFLIFEFKKKKENEKKRKLSEFSLKPCFYKIR